MGKSDGLVIVTLAAALAGCQGARADATTPSVPLAVTVSILSATLAEDCAAPAKAHGGGAAKSDSMAARSCRQTSVQLALASADGAAPSPFSIVRAQLFDIGTGKLLQEMTTRNPKQWTVATSQYQAWDQVVQPRQKLQVSYDMNAPNWSRVGGAQLAQGRSFRLVVTVRINGKDQKVESTVQSHELMVSPHIMT